MLVVAFVVVAVFGLYVPAMGHAGHSTSCPFSLGFAVLCAPMTHMKHWQDALVATLVEALVFVGFVALLFFARHELFDPDVGRFAPLRVRSRTSDRPLLFQELFSDGILNRKEPYVSYSNYLR